MSSNSILEHFPQIDLGEVRAGPDVLPRDWSLKLSDGRTITLTRIEQHRTYGGMLSGVPMDPERTAFNVISEAQEWDRHFHSEPFVVPATIKRGIRPASPDPRGFALYWAMLPPVTTFAQFRCLQTARDPDEICSSALLVWWQDEFGLPTAADLLERLRSIPWERCARDWTP